MKAAILTEKLNKGLSVVSRVISNRGQLPVLGNVLIKADTDGVVLAGTNLDLGLVINAGGKTERPGAVTVPARSLTEYMASIKAEQVTLEMKENKLRVEAGKFGAEFATIPAAEFPAMSVMENEGQKNDKVTIKKADILRVAAEVAYAAAADESRPVLTGVRFGLNESILTVVATDGFRLAKLGMAVEGKGTEILDGLIIPAKTIFELARLAGETKKESLEMRLVKENNQVVFGTGEVMLLSRILEGNFPNVEKIIPGEHKTRWVTDREELTSAVRAAGIFARENSNIIRIQNTDNKITIRAQAASTGESEIEIEAEVEGEENVIAFNYKYVLDFLGSVGTERVALEASGSLAAGVWRAEGEEGLTHLIMPVRV